MNQSGLRVSSSDPYLTKNKWNSVVDIGGSNTSIASKTGGFKFKGIYDPGISYTKGDFVTLDDSFYTIDTVRTQDTVTKGNANNKDYLKINDKVFSIQSNAIYRNGILYKAGSFGQNFTSLAYIDGEKYLYATGNDNKLYKINVIDNLYEDVVMISTFDLDTSFDIAIDEFYVYCKLTSGNIVKINKDDSTYTSFNTIIFNGATHVPKAITIDDGEIHAICNTNYLMSLSKDGTILRTPYFLDYIKNIEKVIIESVNNYDLLIYDGYDNTTNKGIVHALHRNSVNGTFNKVNELKYTFFNTVLTSMHASHGVVLFTNDLGYIEIFYPFVELSIVDPENIFVPTDRFFEIDKYFAIDLTKGNITSHGITSTIQPKGYNITNSIVSEGLLNDTVNNELLKVQFYQNSGAKINSDYRLAYTLPFDLNNKTFFIEMTMNGYNGTSDIILATYANQNNKKIELKIPGHVFNINKKFKCFFNITSSDNVNFKIFTHVYTGNNEYFYKEYEIVATSVEVQNELNINSQTNICYYNKIIILTNFLTVDKIYKYARGYFNIELTNEKAIVPFNKVCLDGLGKFRASNLLVIKNTSWSTTVTINTTWDTTKSTTTTWNTSKSTTTTWSTSQATTTTWNTTQATSTTWSTSATTTTTWNTSKTTNTVWNTARSTQDSSWTVFISPRLVLDNTTNYYSVGQIMSVWSDGSYSCQRRVTSVTQVQFAPYTALYDIFAVDERKLNYTTTWSTSKATTTSWSTSQATSTTWNTSRTSTTSWSTSKSTTTTWSTSQATLTSWSTSKVTTATLSTTLATTTTWTTTVGTITTSGEAGSSAAPTANATGGLYFAYNNENPNDILGKGQWAIHENSSGIADLFGDPDMIVWKKI